MKLNNIHLREISLNVCNIEKISDYYQQTVGLVILSENNDEILLGVKETKFPLVRLVQTDMTDHKKRRRSVFFCQCKRSGTRSATLISWRFRSAKPSCSGESCRARRSRAPSRVPPDLP